MVGARFLSELPGEGDEPVAPPIPAISEVGTTIAPHALFLNRRRTTFEVDLEEVFASPSNGMRVPIALDPASSREARYQAFLLRTGLAATRPEFMVLESLERQGLRGDTSRPPGRDFEFQVGVLGGRQYGGAVIDVVIWAIAPPVAIRVQGEFWHFGDDETERQDIIQKLSIQSLGFTVVDIIAQDTLTEERVDSVVRQAMLGFELDTTGRLTQF